MLKPWLLIGAAASAAALHKQQPLKNHKQASQLEEEMVVVGSRLPTETYKIGRSISVLDQVQIDSLGYEYGADLFRFVPGLAVNRSGGYGGVTDIAYPRLRSQPLSDIDRRHRCVSGGFRQV